MKGFIFALRKQNYDYHSTVFNLLKSLNIKDFTPNHTDSKPLLFHVNGQYIICRTSAEVAGIPLTEQVLEVDVGDLLEGTVTLPRDTPKITMDKQQFDEFVKNKGRKPKYAESHKYTRLTDDEIPKYATKLLEKAGLDIQELKFTDGGYHLISGRGKSIKSVDIHFTVKVHDLAQFEQAWFNGIGRNKTYGFGMIRAVKL